ncbi:MAG: dihydrolipoyl dehydrogenase [Deltaproteobacteria bacterium]
MERAVDVAVLGAGTAGLAAYRAAVASGARAVIIEAGAHGTTCARVGCMPSKLLIAAADAAHTARTAGPFGVRTTVDVDGRAVMDRVRRERDRFVGLVIEGVEKLPREDRIAGRARFVAPGRLEVDGGPVVNARSVVIATGASPVVLPMFEGVRDRLVVNDDVFAWEALPESVAVFGAGVIGLELGQALHRLGVRVRLFGRDGLVGPVTDPVVRAAAARAFEAEFPALFDASVTSVRPHADGVAVTWVLDGEARTETFAHVLVATGRRPNVSGIGLEHAGIDLDARGLPRFDARTMQVGRAPVFIAGDATNDRPLLHEAADEGRIAGENAARFPDVRAGERRSFLAITFTDPQIAIVCATWAELSRRGELIAGEVSFVDQGRSRVMRRNHGAARVYADARTGRFLGAEMAGPSAEHIGHTLAWAHQQGLTVDQMLAMPFYHPVVEEGIRTALRDASARLARRPASAAPTIAA